MYVKNFYRDHFLLIQHEDQFLNSLFNLVRDVVQRMTSHGSGREYGVTLDAIMEELESVGFRNVGGGVQSDLKRHVSRILTTPVNGALVFESMQRVDGATVYRLAEAYGHAYYEYPGTYHGVCTREYEQAMPDTIEELTNEIKRLRAEKEQKIKQQQFLIACFQLLHNPAQLSEETKRIEKAVLTVKDMQSMIDEKINGLVHFLKREFSDSK